MDLSKYVDLFLTEGREHIAEMNAALATLERDASARGAVVEIFRAVHSIKGMAAAMGYAAVTELAHALESTLDSVRSGEDAITPSLIAHLFEETDRLAGAIEKAVSAAVGSQTTSRASQRKAMRTRHLRIDATRLDTLMTLAGELEIARGHLERVSQQTYNETLDAAVTSASRIIRELRDQIITTRMVPVGQVFERFPRLVRETARTLGKDIEFVMDGRDIELDRSMLDEIGDPVVHLLRNAIDHGIETPEERTAAGKPPRGRLTLSAQRESSFVLIRVADDGRGIDRERVLGRARAAGVVDVATQQLSDSELLGVLTQSGFSTADRVTDISGRGVGLDVVDATVRSLGGALEIKSVAGRGTVITLRLPLTVAIVRALLARLGQETFAIPITHVLETVEIDPLSTHSVEGRDATIIREQRFPIVYLRDVVGLPPQEAEYAKAVAVDVRGRRAVLVVDDFVGQQDVVVKRFDAIRGVPSFFGGATILSDGAPALIVDVNSLV